MQIEGRVNKLRCKNCDSEWQPPKNIVSIFCPFCTIPLIEIKEEFFDLNSAFLYMTSEFGKEILKSKHSVLQFLEKFFPNGKREYSFINSLYASGLMETLFKLIHVPEVVQKSAIKQIENQFSDQYGISKEWSEYIIGCVSKAIDLANSVENSIIWLNQVAEKGDLSAQVKLAKRYHLGQGVERDQKQYILWLQRAAHSGFEEALFLLGEELFIGNVCDKDIEKAATYLEVAALKGNSAAICLISSDKVLQRLCNFDIEEKLQGVLEYQNILSAKQLIQISRYYEEKDAEYSLKLAKLSYEKEPKYSWEYYVNLLQKRKSHKHEALALRVIKEIATKGNVTAYILLAKYYEEQARTKEDMSFALYWYRMAAESGSLEAQMRLAEIYETGKNVDKDIESAIYWYGIAAFNGSQIAKCKVSYKCAECLIPTLNLVFEDDTELECKVQKSVTYQGDDYLIIETPDTKELMVVQYIETSTVEGFEINGVNESIEKIILRQLGGSDR